MTDSALSYFIPGRGVFIHKNVVISLLFVHKNVILLLILNGFATKKGWMSAAVIHVAIKTLSSHNYVVNHLYAKQFAALADTMSEVVVLCAGAK